MNYPDKEYDPQREDRESIFEKRVEGCLGAIAVFLCICAATGIYYIFVRHHVGLFAVLAYLVGFIMSFGHWTNHDIEAPYYEYNWKHPMTWVVSIFWPVLSVASIVWGQVRTPYRNWKRKRRGG